MISIYDFSDYRKFLTHWISSQKSAGRGQVGQLGKAAGVSATLISLILKGEKNLSLDQASDLADYLGLNENESDFFFLLVELGRAGTHRLQQKLKKRIQFQQEQAKKISRRVSKDTELTDETKAIYYSNWLYTGVRNLIAVPGFAERKAISERLQIPSHQINKVIEFLLETGLCRLHDGVLTYGPANTHLDSESPFVAKHHQNWRLHAFEFMNDYDESNLFYTCPMSLSAKAAEEIRRLLPSVVEEVLKIVGPSKSEKAYCLNVDWFQY